nr:hypothetical protein [Methylobacterium sp. WL64]
MAPSEDEVLSDSEQLDGVGLRVCWQRESDVLLVSWGVGAEQDRQARRAFTRTHQRARPDPLPRELGDLRGQLRIIDVDVQGGQNLCADAQACTRPSPPQGDILGCGNVFRPTLEPEP